MSVVGGGLPVTGILDNDHWMDLVEQFCVYVPNIYYFDTSICKSLVGLLYHKYMLWSKSVVDLHILQIILLFKWRV